MGLSATQARFLAVTSRKSNCEFRSLQLAQQKLSLTRELQAATEDYQNAMQATRLVWDLNPTDPGVDGNMYALTYDLLMTPSDYNNYIPYLVSRQDGKLAMNSKFIDAAQGIFNLVQDPQTGTWSTDGGLYYGDEVYYAGDKIPDGAGGTLTYEQLKEIKFNEYIDALRDNKAISSGLANIMLEKNTTEHKYVYMNDAGVGGEISGRESANIMGINSLMSYIDYVTINTANGYFEPGSDYAKLADNLIFDFAREEYYDTQEELEAEKQYHARRTGTDTVVGGKRADLSCHLNSGWSATNGSTSLLLNGDYYNNAVFDNDGVANYSTKSVTLADLLNEDVTLMVTGQQNYSEVLEVMSACIQNVSNMSNWTLINDDVDIWYDKMKRNVENSGSGGNNLNDYATLVYKATNDDDPKAKSSLAIINYFDKLAKSMYKLLMPEPSNPSKVAQNAFYTALADVISRFRNVDGYNSTEPNYVTLSGMPFNSEACAQMAVNGADGYNCWVKSGNSWAISLSNLTESFLTNFMNGLDSYQDECLINKKAGTSTYITDNPSYLYTVNLPEGAKENLWQSEFYSIIFNNICANGMYENEQVAEKNYLDNALRNGQLFVVSKGADNHYYQSQYTQAYGENIHEEQDLELLAQAEREYEYIKSKLNYKEDEIDIEMKTIDAEISALSTEMQTVQAMMKSNIEKTFKMFQSS